MPLKFEFKIKEIIIIELWLGTIIDRRSFLLSGASECIQEPTKNRMIHSSSAEQTFERYRR